jgi:PAS domain S-box-containing protein
MAGARTREAYLVHLSDALRPVSDPIAIQQLAARVLGEHLGADRVVYGEIDLASQRTLVHREYRRRPDAPSLVGSYEFARHPTISEVRNAGREFVEHDVERSRRLTAQEKASLLGLEVRAFALAPLMKNGVVSAELVVASSEPRRWTPTELALVEETIQRTWDAVERARAEDAVRRAANANAFRVALSDALRALADPVALQTEAARLLGEYLGANRVIYAEVEPDGEHVASGPDYARDVPAPLARYSVKDFSPAMHAEMAAGNVVVVTDVRTDPRVVEAERPIYARLGVVSMLNVPLMNEGRLAALLSVQQATPRVWSPDEIALVQDIGERTWVAVQRARADERRRKAEERYLALFNAIEQGFCTIEVAFDEQDRPVDYRFLEVSPSFERQTGIRNAAGRWMREIAPDQDEHWFELYGRVARTGEPMRFESYSTPLKRWWSVYAFRIQDPQLRRIAVLFHDISDRKRAEEALERAHAELERRVEERTRELEVSRQQLEVELAERRTAESRIRTILEQLITAQENERRRIARDLHDNLGQRMTVLHLKLDALRRKAGEALEHDIVDLQLYAQQIDRDLRFFTWELRPAGLYQLGLVPALEDYVRQWSVNYGIQAEFDALGLGSERLPFDIEINLFRIAQEALHNVFKHAQATKVEVLLQRLETRVILIIEDNGVGIDSTKSHGETRHGFGLTSMRERAELMRGTCRFESVPGSGTTVIVSVALD